MNDNIRNQAESFINSINETDNVAIITDHDPDGFTSGTLFFDHCLKKNAKVTQFTFTRNASHIDNFKLEDYNKIITTDLNVTAVLPILEKYMGKEILFMDHHPKEADVPKGVIEYRTMYRGYIPSARSAFELCKGKKWLSLAGVVIDAGFKYKENDEFIKTALDEENMTLEEFQEKVAFPIGNMIIYLNDEPEKAFELIRNLPNFDKLESIEKYYKPIDEEIDRILELYKNESENIGGITYFYFEPKYSVKGPVINTIALKPKNNDRIFVFASPNKKGKVTFSARCQAGKVNMADILLGGIGDLEGKAGGHFNASGGAVNTNDLEQFKINLRNYLKENPIS